MGKPLGLLQRIFSFSKNSKHSSTPLDLLRSADEHGQPVDEVNYEGATGRNAHTIGGIGGLGNGITTSSSNFSPLISSASAKGRNGIKKQRLRRASLSASNLLSWGHEKVGKSTLNISSDGPHERVESCINVSQSTSSVDGTTEGHSGSQDGNVACEQVVKRKDTHYKRSRDSKMSNGYAHYVKRADNDSNTREMRPIEKPSTIEEKLEANGSDQFTRLLRSSSAKYKVIRETDFRDLTPIDHPINALTFPRVSSERQPPASPSSVWSSRSQARTLTFPPSRAPSSLLHIPSVTSSTNATSTFKVTVHRRRVHSRTSFPNANRALDRLHSSSSVDASISSASASSEVPRIAPKGENMRIKKDKKGLKNDQSGHDPQSATSFCSKIKSPRAIGPSMIPRWSFVGHSNKGRGRAISQVYKPATSQVYPVTPLRAIPLKSQRISSDATEIAAASSNQNTAVSCCDTALAEEETRYTIPLKDSDLFSDQNIELATSVDREEADTSFSKSTRRTKGVLRKKCRESQTSVSSLKRANSVKSVKSSKSDEESGTGARLREGLMNIFRIADIVDGVDDRLQTSAVGEVRPMALRSPRSPSIPESHGTSSHPDILVEKNEEKEYFQEPTAPMRSSLNIHCRLHRKATAEVQVAKHASISDTPQDKVRLANLRKDPSVASLLDVYETDGTLKRTVFSNTPPTKKLGHSGHHCIPGCIDSRMKTQREHAKEFYKTKRTQVKGTSSSFSTLADDKISLFFPDSLGSHGTIGQSINSSGPHTPLSKSGSLQIDLSSSSELPRGTVCLDMGASTSLLVEAGSYSSTDISWSNSSPNTGTMQHDCDTAQRKSEGIYTPKKRSNNGGDAIDLKSKSPNRRASQVFAFLCQPKEDPNSSFEVGRLDVDDSASHYGSGVNIGAEMDACFGQSPRVPLLCRLESPTKKPLGPRSGPETSLNISGVRLKEGARNILHPLPPISSIDHSRTVDSKESSSVQLTGATFESDSFASQNTTDRSIYRGIYSYLKETTSNPAHSTKAGKLTQTSSSGVIQQTPLRTGSSTFLTTMMDTDKSLPSTPSSDSNSQGSPIENRFVSPHKRTGLFTALPAFTPMSPFDPDIATHRYELPSTPDTPSPVRLPTYTDMKERITEGEATRPLDIESIRRKSSVRSSVMACYPVGGTSVVSGKGSSSQKDNRTNMSTGLGGSLVFNSSANQPKKLHGPRSLSPTKSSTVIEPKAEVEIDRAPKSTSIIDLTQGYPFCEELFPALFMSVDPTTTETSNVLQTPPHVTSQNDPSPASSSKLGFYGREIMALARSKSGKLLNTKRF